ncbi:MAG: sigma factor-like helix-turn-helix DNA-binding protein, partial [Verrucomicrobiota bacterium]
RYLSFLDRFFRHSEVESSMAEAEADARLLELLEINLSALAPDERALIEKKYFHRDSVSDIAEQLQSSEKAIESRLVRVRRKLKELILVQLKHEK